MKSIIAKGAIALVMAVSASAQTGAPTPMAMPIEGAAHDEIRQKMQDNVAKDINAIIAKYDYAAAYEQAQKEFQEAEAAKAALNKSLSLEEATAEELMQALTSKLKQMRDGKSGENFFPTATGADAKYLDHLNMKIDLHDHSPDSIVIETAAKDAHGSAIYKKSWSNDKVETIQPVAVVPTQMTPVPETATAVVSIEQAIKANVEQVIEPSVVVPTTTTTIAAVSTDSPLSGSPDVDAKRQAELDEARDVAFQVVFFFIALIFASFGLLYIYHAMSQERAQQAGKANSQRKETFFEFLAGNLEEDYPQTARAAGSATRYQV